MPISAVYPSLYGLEFIKRYQGLSLEKYQDADNLWLIGYGHLIRDREYFDAPLTPQQAEAIFQADVDYYQQVLRQCIHVPLTQCQFDALLSLAFSLGPEAVQQSPIVYWINHGDMNQALAEWQREGERESSLAGQRQAESALFQTGGLRDIPIIE